jgi:hypothetical protein
VHYGEKLFSGNLNESQKKIFWRIITYSTIEKVENFYKKTVEENFFDRAPSGPYKNPNTGQNFFYQHFEKRPF